MKALILSLALAACSFAFANPAPENYPLVNGLVKKINLQASKVTIKHEEIPNLDMAAMTMTFQSAQPELLKGLSEGDQIQFAADEVAGVLTLIWWEKKVPDHFVPRGDFSN